MNNWIENSPQRTAPSCPMKMPSIFLYFSEPWLNYMATLSEGFGWWYPDALTFTREKKLLMSANYVSWAQPVGFQQSLFITTGVSSCYSVEFHLENFPRWLPQHIEELDQIYQQVVGSKDSQKWIDFWKPLFWYSRLCVRKSSIRPKL